MWGSLRLAPIIETSTLLMPRIILYYMYNIVILLFTVSGFAFFQFYCFEVGSINIPSVADGLVNTTAVQTFLNTTEDFAAVGCRFTDPLRDFFNANAPWYEYQKETWLVLGELDSILNDYRIRGNKFSLV